MNLLNRLEKPLGWMAIGHLPLYVVAAQVLLYIWVMLNPEAEHLLLLDPYAVQNGEYWRLLTFLFVTPSQNVLFVFLYLYFQYYCGQALEEEWGSFKLTMFYLVGVAGAIGASYLVGGNTQGAFYLNQTIFLAFAALHPNFTVLLIILPLKVKWLAWLTWAQILFDVYRAPWIWKLAIAISLTNYVVFFTKPHIDQVLELIRRIRHRQRYKEFSKD